MNIKKINESFSRMSELGLFGKNTQILKENWSQNDIEKMKELLASGDMDNIKLVEQMASPHLFRDLVDSVYGILLIGGMITGRDTEAIEKLFMLNALNLSSMNLSFLPEIIWNLHNLESLEVSSNHLSTIPESIGNLNKLKWLYLYKNQLSTLPERIGDLSELQGLMLSNNSLTTLPESIGKLSKLKWLNLENNNFSKMEKKHIKTMLPKCDIYF